MDPPGQIAGQRLEGVHPRSRERHLGSLGVKRPGDGPPDAAAGAGDESAFSLKIEHDGS